MRPPSQQPGVCEICGDAQELEQRSNRIIHAAWDRNRHEASDKKDGRMRPMREVASVLEGG
jgi:hypothetical protein